MTNTKDTTFFENKLLQFITEEDQLWAMPQWVTDKLVEVEVAQNVNFLKGKHSKELHIDAEPRDGALILALGHFTWLYRSFVKASTFHFS